MRIEAIRSQIYSELSQEYNKKLFDYKDKAFLHNIDTLYYAVYLKDDQNDNEQADKLCFELGSLKSLKKSKQGKKDEEITYKDLLLKLGTYGIVYNYRLSEPDKYDIFIADYLPNDKTPRAVIQIRSFGLWCFGIESIVKESFEKVQELFSDYDLVIEKTMENRLDYCWHTNVIQNPYKFFSDKKLDQHLHTSLEIYQKIGKVKKKRDLTLEYLAFGQRKSNNVFFRCYNKTREVIEENYKSFFFELWYQDGLISKFDKYCLEYAYEKKNYDALHKARLLFYLEHGTDHRAKKEIELLFSDTNARYTDFEYLANILVPPVTIVMNIEYQTKRKFYYHSDAQIATLKTISNVPQELKRVFQIVDNRPLFLDYLTSETLGFYKDNDCVKPFENEKLESLFMSWWKRLRSLKIDKTNKIDFKYLRAYAHNTDLNKLKKRAVNAVASYSTYKGNENTSIVNDVSDLIADLNDNDIRERDRLALVSMNTGDVISDVGEKISIDYMKYKENKYLINKNKIPNKKSPSVKGKKDK